jgi:uncharacterized protein YbjT (DUF2867 family)
MTLVVGATGALGIEVCTRLRALGLPVRALVRGGSDREPALAELGVEFVRGDLRDPASLKIACSGVSRVITTANAVVPRRDGDTLKSVDLNGHLSLVSVAESAGVEHFVYTSVSSEANPRAVLVRYKRRVERAIRESGMEWTILQPAAFMDTWFSPAAGWDLVEGQIRIVGPGTVKSNPVAMCDVAEFAALAAARDDLRRRVIPIGGPDIVTALEAVRLFEEILDRKFVVKHVPAAVIGLASRLLRPFKPALSSFMALAAGTGEDEVLDMALVLAEIPVELTPLGNFILQHHSS